MKASIEYATSETCDDVNHVLDFHARVVIEERVFLMMDPRHFIEELRYLLIRTGHELLEAADGRPYKLTQLWESRTRIRLSDRKIPVIKPLTAKEFADGE